MKTLHFNKIFVIESLRENDRKSGKELYDDLLRYQMMRYPNLKVEYRHVKDKGEWDALMDEIAVDCRDNGSQAILHLEIHGEESGGGLVLVNGDYLSYDSIRPQFVNINVASRCNLFLTLAVCKGLFVTSVNRLSEPMPFCGLLGSYDEINEDDLVIRFNEFYDELFTSFSLAKAYKRLLQVNSGVPHSYRFVHADELFCKVYQQYNEQNCNENAIKQRALDAAAENNVQLPTRQMKRKFQRDFEEQEKASRLQFFLDAANNYFLLEMFPENRERFEVPSDLKQLKERVRILSY